MSLSVVFRRAARREFDEAALWYEARRVGLGSAFVLEIDRAVALAAEDPNRFPVMHANVRCLRVRRFPYSIFFLVESERLVVLAVFHARRDPMVWRMR